MMYFGLHLAIVWIIFDQAQGADYLIAVLQRSYKNSLSVVAATDITGGMFEVQFPDYGVSYETKLRKNGTASQDIPTKFHLLDGLEFKGILVKTSNEATKIIVMSDFYKYNVFSPLPTSALGTKYIVSTCRQTKYSSLLVIAAHHKKTTVNIIFKLPHSFYNDGRTFKNGDKHQLQLGPYQTYTWIVGPDLTGTIITSTHPVAVFSGMMNSTFVTAYEQLLPVRLYGQEYVVAVDSDESPYHLQIISEHNNTNINFNNGTSVTVSSLVYSGHLTRQKNFYFRASFPVMATLCKRNNTDFGFLGVPPVSLYPTAAIIRFYQHPAIMLSKRNTILNTAYLTWKYIPNSEYKVATLSRNIHNLEQFQGSVLTFKKLTMFNNGISSEIQHQDFESAKSYIVALPRIFRSYLTVSGETDAIYQVFYPHQERRDTRTKSAFSSDYYYIRDDVLVEGGVENKTVLVNFNTDHIHMSLAIDGYSDNEWSFSVLPTFALGRKYIVHSCYNSVKDFKLIIASMNTETIIDVAVSQSVSFNGIVYNAGDTITVSLKDYQTLTLNSNAPLCGTELSATQNVAVFTLVRLSNRLSYIQLLPLKEWRQTYIAAVDDKGDFSEWRDVIRNASLHYFLLITSSQNNTQVTFNDKEQVTVGRGDSYHKAMRKNESVFFSSNKPVMSSVCVNVSFLYGRDSRQFTQSGCTILVPVDLYANYSIFVLTRDTNIRIFSDSRDADVTVTWSQGRSWRQTIDVSWELYTEYRVGSAVVARGTVYVTSSHRFTVLTYSLQDYLHVDLLEYLGPEYWDAVGTIWNAGIFGSPSIDSMKKLTPNGNTSVSDNNSESKNCIITHNDELSPVNMTAIAIGTIFGVAILILLSIVIFQQLYIRRTTGKKRTKTGNTVNTGSSLGQIQPEATASVSTISTSVLYSDLHTENQQINLYEKITPSTSAGDREYENYETRN